MGGCNSNFVSYNDFSHAVANSIEATFSRGNLFLDNLCNDSNYGIWAGYSFDTRIEHNTLESNNIAGIAIEHGSDINVWHNEFRDNPVAVMLWWDDDKQFLQGVYGEKRHCRSEGYRIYNNAFRGGETAVRLVGTSDVWVVRNLFDGVKSVVVKEGQCEKVRIDRSNDDGPHWHHRPRDLWPGRRDTRLPEGALRGRKYIMVDEWGPLDPTESAVFPKRVVAWEECAFHVLGPAVEYEVVELAGEVTLELLKVRQHLPVRVHRPAVGAGHAAQVFPVAGDPLPLHHLDRVERVEFGRPHLVDGRARRVVQPVREGEVLPDQGDGVAAEEMRQVDREVRHRRAGGEGAHRAGVLAEHLVEQLVGAAANGAGKDVENDRVRLGLGDERDVAHGIGREILVEAL